MFAGAEAYSRFMGRWSRLAAPLLLDFAGELPAAGRVCDVGSGTGSLAFAIAGRYPALQVLGIDPSTEYVAYAVSKNPYPGRVAFAVGDAQAFNYPDASFDAALSLLVFNFIPRPAGALRELRRVTKPGGRIAAAVWDYGDGMRMLRLFWDAAAKVDPAAAKHDEKYAPLCRAGELEALWKQAGCKNVRERALEITTSFSSFAGFWDPFLLGQGPAGAFVKDLDPGRRAALRDELRRRLPISDNDGPFSLPARLWAVRGN